MYPVSLQELIDEFNKLPGIGHKSAVRLAFHVMNMPEAKVEKFVSAINKAKTSVHLCSKCQNLTDKDECDICSSPRRDAGVICVMESPKDVTALEKTKEYNGLYHVLHGAISPLDGIGPEQLTIKELLARLSNEEVKEIIIATDSDIEGEATAMYLSKLIKPFNLNITRIAFGLPVGTDIQYADEVTLSRAIEGRRIM